MIQPLQKAKEMITRFLHHHTTRVVDENSQKFRLYPRWIIGLVLFLSYNVVIQGIGDVIIKIAGYTPWFSPLPMRLDFLFLTAVSVLMGYQALKGMRRRELDVTRNSVALGLLVELSLVVSDITHLIQFGATHPSLMWIRLPFIILTTINFFILFFIAKHLKLFVDEQGKLIIA
ncbi:MAG: hypothetical protein AB7J40_04555 [Candidatus Altimarinota bacterium]